MEFVAFLDATTRGPVWSNLDSQPRCTMFTVILQNFGPYTPKTNHGTPKNSFMVCIGFCSPFPLKWVITGSESPLVENGGVVCKNP